jgi:hypothetical protein
LIAELKAKASLVEGEVLALDKVLSAAHTSAGERSAVLSRCVPAFEAGRGPDLALVVADTVSVASAHAIRSVEKLSEEKRQGSAALVDLWGRAEACRALWFETYVLWPRDNTTERRQALAETVMQLASESIGMALRFSGVCQQFVDFVRKVSGELEQLKGPNP